MSTHDAPAGQGPETGWIVLFDGVCGLCSRAVQFILRHDRSGIFRFAPLQSESGSRLAASHGIDVEALDTIVLLEVTGRASRAFVRSDAALEIVRRLDGAWRFLAFLRVIPRFVRDPVYRLVARVRYRVFGRLHSCWMPSAEYEDRFLPSQS